jgi:hypothetical protein
MPCLLAYDPTTKTVAVIDLAALPRKFGDPDKGRTPDLMVQPNPRVIYTTSHAKDMEHGGAAPDDGHVAPLVSHPSLEARTVERRAQKTQVAQTVIRALGLNPRLLEAVRKEGTRMLPHTLSEEPDDD